MNLEKAQRLTGAEIRIERDESTGLVTALIDDEVGRIEVKAGSWGEALERLVERYRQTAYQKAVERAKWRCENCGGIGRLQVHHLVPRSVGGSHHLRNLVVLCSECHRWRHGGY